jgi:hypothetical protein
VDSREVVALVNGRRAGASVQARAIVAWAAAAGWTVARTASPTPQEIGDICEDVRQGRVAGAVAIRLDVLGDVVDQEVIRAVLARSGGRLLIVEERDAQEVGDHPTEEVRELLRLYEERMTATGRQATRAKLHRAAGAVRAEGGRTGGRTPYGWRMVAGQLVEDAREQAIRTRIRTLSDRGESYAAIGRQLEVEGYVKRDGSTTWHPDTVRRIVLRMDQESAAAS